MKIQPAPPPRSRAISRRRFIRLGAAVFAMPTLTRSVHFGFQGPLSDSKCLSFYNIHTGESLSATYSRSGQLLPSALQKINHVLQDHRTDEVREIDVRLLDLLHRLAGEVRCSQAVDIRLPGFCLSDLRKAALSLKAGGVGYYPKPDFVHVDVGRVRCW